MSSVKLDCNYCNIDEKEIMKYKEEVAEIHKQMHSKANDEKDFLGWLELPTNYDKEEFERIKKSAKKIRKRY